MNSQTLSSLLIVAMLVFAVGASIAIAASVANLQNQNLESCEEYCFNICNGDPGCEEDCKAKYC